MSKRILSILLAISMIACLFSGLTFSVSADTENGYYYSVSNGKATITKTSSSISGDVTIPSTLGGCPVTSIGSSAFSGCTGLTSVTIGNSVTSIGDYAFYRCTGLTSVTIGNSVTSIGDKAFYGCTGLTSIEIPDSVTSIGYFAFYGCTGLESVTIGNSVTSIGDFAFRGCTGLTSIIIPNSVTSIGGSAFIGCTGLTSITIPDSVTSIGEGAFYGCTGLTKVNYTGTIDKWCKISFNSYYSNPLYYAHNLYINDEKVENLVIPDSVTNIGWYAFSGCNELTSVTIGNSVTSIGNSAFENCTGLKSITIPNSVTSIGEYAFSGCTGLTSITVEEGNPNYHSSGNCLIDTESKKLIAGCKNSIIPNDGSVTSIGEFAFYGCTGLTSIEIPTSVTSIDGAFSGCTGLTSITVEEGNPKYHSSGNCLIDTESKKLIAGCKNSIIPNDGSVTSIAGSAFSGCSGLTSIVIPDSVTSIDEYAFSGCTGLTSIEISNSVTSIGEGAFCDCTGLTSVTIGNSVTSIGSGAFYGCTGLTSIEIPGSVTDIGSYAFSGCTGLTDVYYTGTEQDWNNISIGLDNDYLTNANIHYNYVPHTHTFSETWVGDKENHWKKCECGEKDSVGAHTWDSGEVTKSATCTDKGIKTYTCTVCNATKTEEIAATGHKEVIDLAVEPTCTATGLTEGKHCSVCNEILVAQNTIAEKGHSWGSGEVTKSATCTDKGIKTYTCTVCNATKTEEIAATGHKSVTDPAVAATCTKPGKTAGKHCSVCNKVITAQTTVKATGHTSDGGKVTKATLTKAGKKVYTCKVCKKVLKTETIAYPKSISLAVKSYTYNGKVMKPAVKVIDSNGKTIASSNYSVTYSSGCKNVGKYSVKITFKGNYTGTKTFTFTINPKGTTVSKLTTPKTKQIKVTWGKQATQTTGYVIQYSTSKTFASGNKTVTVTSNKTISKTLTGLTKGKTYYVRIRTYKTVKGTKYYSAWCKAKSIKTK